MKNKNTNNASPPSSSTSSLLINNKPSSTTTNGKKSKRDTSTTTATTNSSTISPSDHQHNNSTTIINHHINTTSQQDLLDGGSKESSNNNNNSNNSRLVFVSILSSLILLFLIIYIPYYYSLDIIYIILPIISLILPLLLYELYQKIKSIYLEHVLSSNQSTNFIYLFLFTFTSLVLLASVLFFTYETLEHSYYDQFEEFNTKSILVHDLQNELLDYCYLNKVCCERDLIPYIGDHLNSMIRFRNQEKFNRKLAIENVLNSIRKNKSFKLIENSTDLKNDLKNELNSNLNDSSNNNNGGDFNKNDQSSTLCYEYKYKLKPMNIYKYIKSHNWHDHVQTFIKRLTKGFGLTHD